MRPPSFVSIPRGEKVSGLSLFFFDVCKGAPEVVRVLWRSLNFWQFIRVFLVFGWRSLASNPYKVLGPPSGLSRREQLTRRQLRHVLILDEILRDTLGLSNEETVEILSVVVGHIGARFLGWNLPSFKRKDWESMAPQKRFHRVERVLDRFFNMEAGVLEGSDSELAFDVTGCLFLSLTQRLGKSYLAPLFCLADSVYFDDEQVPVSLKRTSTLAHGGECCDFRLKFKDEKKSE